MAISGSARALALAVALTAFASSEAGANLVGSLSLHGVAGYADGFAVSSVGGVNVENYTGLNQFRTAIPYATGGSVVAGAASDTTRISSTIRKGNVGYTASSSQTSLPGA